MGRIIKYLKEKRKALKLLQDYTSECQKQFESACYAFDLFQKEFDTYQSHFRKALAEAALANRGTYIDVTLSSGCGDLQEKEEAWRKARGRSMDFFNKIIVNFYHPDP